MKTFRRNNFGAARARRDAGFTLVEIVVAMVIIATASVTLVGVMSSVSERSATAMQQVQAANVADAYLRQIMARPFPPAAGNVDTFNLYHASAQDQFGTAIGGLTEYQVNVAVVQAAWNAIPAAQSRLITVTVTSPTQAVTILRGYKTAHP
jgi:MSHA pilin protein MshD